MIVLYLTVQKIKDLGEDNPPTGAPKTLFPKELLLGWATNEELTLKSKVEEGDTIGA